MNWKNRRKWYKIVSALACIVVFCTVYALILPAVTLERTAQCGVEEHTHTEECYMDGVLSCGKEEHIHTEACYASETATETAEEMQSETETDQISETVKDTVAGTENTAETANLEADTEAADDWEQTIANVSLTGDWAKDLQAIAESQIGYKESTENYIIDENGRKCGYSRYGQWYGEPYSEWSALFVSWCLHYAEVENVPESSDIVRWTALLKEAQLYKDAGTYSPIAGDIVLVDEETQDGKTTDHAGIITDVNDDHIRVIEGDQEDQVMEVTYDRSDAKITGYAVLPSHPESDAENTTSEKMETAEFQPETLAETIDETQSSLETEQEEVDNAKVYAGDEATIHTADTAADVDFGPYITSANIQKLENGTWKDSTTFTDGDQVRVSLSYNLPANAVNQKSDTIYYQLPAGVRPIQNESGQVYHNGVYVGDYVIDTDGLITIKFNEKFANGEAFSGSIEFKGTVNKSEAGEDGKIRFDGNGGEFTVEDQKTAYDIQMKKSGQLGEDGKTISYVLTASTTNGTEGTVTIKDHFNNSSASGTYNQDAKIYKIDASENRSEVTGYEPQYTNDSFTIENLPKLEAGEKYIVEYTAEAKATNADGSGSLSNSASAESNGKKQEVWNNVDVAKSMVSKEGGYDNVSNTINWTVTINQSGKDLNGYQISDQLTSKNGTVQAPDKVKLKNTRTGEEIEVTLPYTFDTSTKDTYMLTYQTPAGTTDDTVKNTVSVTDPEGKTYTSEKTVGVTMRDWAISKSWAKEGVDEQNRKLYYWNMEVTIPEKDLETFTYTDTIQDAVCDGKTKTGSHYAIAADLQKAIEANLKLVTDQATLGYNNDQVDFVINYYDASGKTVDANDTETHVVRFTISVKPKEGQQIKAKRLQLNDYPTVVDTSDAKEGENWTFGNTASIPDKTSEASHTFEKKKKLVKQGGLKVDDNNISYSEGTTTVDYKKTGGILYYRILINTDKGQNDAITLEDILPKGAEVVQDSVKVQFYDNEYYQPTDKWVNGQQYDLTGSQKPTVTTRTRSDDTTELKVVIPEGYNDSNSANAFVVYYQVRIDQDTYWSDMNHEEQNYINRVTWDGNEAEQTTEVNREVTKLNKTAQQIQDSDGNYTNVVEYQVVINPAGANLNPASSSLTLSDTLELPSGVNASLDLANTALYYYSSSAEKNRGDVIDSTRYQVSYDENTHEMKVIVPDELACVFVYRYTIDNGNVATPTLKNKVSLMGSEWSSQTSHVLNEISSSAEVQKGKLTIYKVDRDNYKKLLPDAEFLLEMYDADQNQWSIVNTDGSHTNGIYTTDSNGEIVFQGSDKNQVLHSNHLYRLTEEKAPDGYAKAEQPFYFVLMKSKNQYDSSVNKNQSQEDLAYQDMKAVFDQTGVNRSDVAFRANDAQVSMYIPNDYTNVSVRKIWVDANGMTINNPPSGVDVQLYRQVQKKKGYQVTLNICQFNNTSNVYWTKTVQVKANSRVTLIWPAEWNDNQLGTDFTVPEGCSIAIQGNANRGKPVITTGEITGDCTVNIGCSWYDSPSAEPTVNYESDYEVVKEAVPNGKVTLNNDNQWQYTWESLSKEDAQGNSCYYTVEEISPPAGYTVTISNNEGIQKGDIVITNKKDQQSQDYELPKTGGPGTMGYTLGGLLLMAAAGIFMYKQKSRRKEDKHFTF